MIPCNKRHRQTYCVAPAEVVKVIQQAVEAKYDRITVKHHSRRKSEDDEVTINVRSDSEKQES